MPICLNMIVRDESAVIERCLASVRPFIDTWVIVDTGSLDDTPARIHRALAGISGELYHRPWKNFGHNRTEALHLAQQKFDQQFDYLLFIDADETLGASPDFRFPSLTEGAYSLETRFNELRYDRVSLVSTRLPWRWEGVLHEYLEAGQTVPQPRLEGLWLDVRSEGARSRDPLKFQKDAAVLEEALRHEPNNARYAFYLAQSWRDCGQYALARAHYERRSIMGGWDEEVWYALYQIARLSEFMGDAKDTVVAHYLRAYSARPTRVEPLVVLARYLRGQQDWNLAYLVAQSALPIPFSNDRLFVDATAYAWVRYDELALAAFYTGHTMQAEMLWQQLLQSPDLPVSERPRIQENLGFIPR